MTNINSNSVSLAGEYAVLSQLALRGYDANMTLGRTKGVDILVSNPKTGKMLKLEVKTNLRMVKKHYSHLAPSYEAAAIRAGAPRFAGAKTPSSVVPMPWRTSQLPKLLSA